MNMYKLRWHLNSTQTIRPLATTLKLIPLLSFRIKVLSRYFSSKIKAMSYRQFSIKIIKNWILTQECHLCKQMTASRKIRMQYQELSQTPLVQLIILTSTTIEITRRAKKRLLREENKENSFSTQHPINVKRYLLRKTLRI